jgi:hypothetical protein
LAEGLQSERVEKRKFLPTARVGVTLPLCSDVVVQAVVDGKTQALERGSKCAIGPDGEVIPAAAVHDPMGRQKQSGRIEYTMFDVEPNVEKVALLESALSLYTNAVYRAALRPENSELSLGNCKLALGARGELYLGVLQDNDRFLQLAESLDRGGFVAKIEFAGEQTTVGDELYRFLTWVSEFSQAQGFSPEGRDSEDFANLDRLKQLVVYSNAEEMVARSFSDYFAPDSEHYMVGNTAMVAHNYFNDLVAQDMLPLEAYLHVLQDLSAAYVGHTALIAGKFRPGLN